MNKGLVYLLVSVFAVIVLVVLRNHYPQSETAVPEYNTETASLVTDAYAPAWKDTSWSAGLIANHHQLSHHLTSAQESLGAGVCVLDINNDNWMDILIVGGNGTTREYGREAWWHHRSGDRLFINRAGHRFEDITDRAGINVSWQGMGCAVADLNNDGYSDIIISGVGGHLIYRNLGNSTFTPVENDRSANELLWSTQAALNDFNRDGLVDFYSARFIRYAKGQKTFEASKGFLALKQVDFDPELYDPQPSQLLVNRSEMRFETAVQSPTTQNVLGRSLGANWQDLNRDGMTDLLVINGFGTPNRVFMQARDGSFNEQPHFLRRAQVSGSRTVVTEDFTGDRSAAIYVVTGSGQRNIFLEQTGEGQFSDTSEARGLSKKQTLYADQWGAVTADFNNDGYPDMYIASGKILPDEDSEFVSKSQPNSAFMNTPTGVFNLVSGDDPKVVSGSSRGVASIDVNNDGVLELVVANNNGPVQLLSNTRTTENNWVGIAFRDILQWIGGTIELRTENRVLYQSISFKQGMFSQSDPRFHFGLGKESTIESIVLSKSGMRPIQLTEVEPGHYYQVTRDNTLTKLGYASRPSALRARLEQAEANALHGWRNMLTRPDVQRASRYTPDTYVMWHRLPAIEKRALLKTLVHRQDETAIGLILEALSDEDPKVLLAALSALHPKEMENSVYRLLPLLQHHEAPIVCQVSEMFRFYYEQEEAIVHRKQLAVAPMMKALATSDEARQLCLMEALGASENKRAAEGLIGVLQRDVSQDVLASAIRALGQVRDVKGVEHILSLINDEAAPLVVAEGLVALSRLRYAELDDLFDEIFLQPSDRLAQMNRLQALLTNTSYIVLPQSWLRKAMDFQIRKLGPPADNDALVTWLTLAGEAKQSSNVTALTSFLSSQQTEVRAAAYSSTLRLASRANKIALEKKLATQSLETQERVLTRLKQREYRFSNEFLAQLARQILQSSTSEQMLALPALLKSEDQASFMAIALSLPFGSTHLPLIEFARSQCIGSELVDIDKLDAHKPPQQYTLLNWVYGCESGFEENMQQVRWRVMLNEVLNSDKISRQDRLALIHLASRNDSFVANHWLPTVAEDVGRANALRLFNAIPPQNRGEAVLSYLHDLHTDQSLSASDRLYAYSLTKAPQMSVALALVGN